MNAVDTNVLLYIHDSREPTKQQQAASLILSLSDGALLWQVACEYLAASRKLEPLGFDRSHAWQNIQKLRQVWTTVLPTWSTLELTDRLLSRYSLSFWDALIIAACLESGVKRLYSEDFGAYPRIDGLEIVNPFTEI
jgi:predicted nucleic acid-binding protein